MARHTRGFATIAKLQEHFRKHGARLGLATAAEYEDLADGFMASPRPCRIMESVRCGNADKLRFDPQDEIYVALRNDGVIKTCYKPDPAIHGEVTNAQYFAEESKK